MKKSDKIVVIVSTIIILCIGIYLFSSEIIFASTTLPIILIISSMILILIIGYYVQGIIVKKRIAAFAELGRKYSLKHSYAKFIIFEPYGVLNHLVGKINNREIIVADMQLEPTINQTAKNIATQGIITRAVFGKPIMATRAPGLLRTVIMVDGKNIVPVGYKEFLPINKVKEYLEKVK